MSSEHGAAQAAAFAKPTLSFYDYSVLGFSNRFVWKCPTPYILDFYNQHVTPQHLDVGPGTGYFLDKCRFPAPPAITLVDVFQGPLELTAKRIMRYQPQVCQASVLEPLPLPHAAFDSISISYVLHCLPGEIASKAAHVFRNLTPHLRPGGIVFGTTILSNIPVGRLATRFLDVYNKTGVFHNKYDTEAALGEALQTHFVDSTLTIRGCVAFFTGKQPRTDQP
jgi:ubiquinone/menaquinone biosynthesis C-methylase UbiE